MWDAWNHKNSKNSEDFIHHFYVGIILLQNLTYNQTNMTESDWTHKPDSLNNRKYPWRCQTDWKAIGNSPVKSDEFLLCNGMMIDHHYTARSITVSSTEILTTTISHTCFHANALLMVTAFEWRLMRAKRTPGRWVRAKNVRQEFCPECAYMDHL